MRFPTLGFVLYVTSKGSDQPAHTHSLIRAFASCLPDYSMALWLLSEHHLEFPSLIDGFTGSSESTLVKMPHCWKTHVVAHISYAPIPHRPRIPRIDTN